MTLEPTLQHTLGDGPVPVDLLAIGAHPDDVEYGMGGTLVRHHRLGHRIGVVDLTRGELGSKGTPERRRDEAAAAARGYGAAFRVCLDLGDNRVAATEDAVHRLAWVLRRSRPRVVASHLAEERHPDHRAAHELVRRAVFAAALRTLDLDAEHHVVAATLAFPTDRALDGDLYVDVSDVWEARLDTMHAFASQFAAPTQAIDRRLYGTHDHLEQVAARARVQGQAIGVAHAEAFLVDRGVPVDDLVAAFAPPAPGAPVGGG
ncbi:MAG: bacillithiol biosynthesis deacetylase BshB1 [Nitriliruptoraceae bacterium]